MSPDALTFLRNGAEGVAEAAYGPFASIPLALSQVVVWALVSRRNALREVRSRVTHA